MLSARKYFIPRSAPNVFILIIDRLSVEILSFWDYIVTVKSIIGNYDGGNSQIGALNFCPIFIPFFEC